MLEQAFPASENGFTTVDRRHPRVHAAHRIVLRPEPAQGIKISRGEGSIKRQVRRSNIVLSGHGVARSFLVSVLAAKHGTEQRHRIEAERFANRRRFEKTSAELSRNR